jgi:hypothetical protein
MSPPAICETDAREAARNICCERMLLVSRRRPVRLAA